MRLKTLDSAQDFELAAWWLGEKDNYQWLDFGDGRRLVTPDEVGFVDPARGDYRLALTSLYKGAGTDGKDIGADIDAIDAAINGIP